MSLQNKLLAVTVAVSCLATATVATRPASAAPLVAFAASGPVEVTPVQWRRGPGGPRWFGPGLGAAIVGGIIVGGAITAAAIAENRAEPAALRRCARDFPDFDRRSGTYIDRHGEVRVCPYLY
ncbi:MAG: hypothetical protein JSS20_18165 [Proteobacteria bacterium]|nr:hypothetical protein [Pseudomonadota bacterium]